MLSFESQPSMQWAKFPLLRQITHIPVALRTNNLGDDIQSLALQRLIGFTAGQYVDRDAPQRWPKDALIPLCGWFGWGRFPTPAEVLVVGFHCRPLSRANLFQNRQWLAAQVKQQGFPAMCRDISTREFLRMMRIDAEFGGCVTLHLERYDGR